MSTVNHLPRACDGPGKRPGMRAPGGRQVNSIPSSTTDRRVDAAILRLAWRLARRTGRQDGNDPRLPLKGTPVGALSHRIRAGARSDPQAGRLQFFADQAALAQPAACQTFLAALRKLEWVVYAKRPFGGPDAVLAYLSRYTHRTAIANSRLVAFAGERVTFKSKDYRAKGDARYKLMTLDADEFIRRF